MMKTKVRFIALLGLAVLLGFSTSASAKKPVDTSTGEWYMKTYLNLVNLADGSEWADRSSGVFGKLAASSDGYDQHDIRAFASNVGSSPAALVFVQGEDWGEYEGEFLSSYHSAGSDLNSWPFAVFSNVEGAEVTLTWDGLFELTAYQDGGLTRYAESQTLDSDTLKKLKLIDLKTGEVTNALAVKGKKTAELGSYTFYLDDGESSRQFAWIIEGATRPGKTETQKVDLYIQKQQKEFDRLEQEERMRDLGAPGELSFDKLKK